MSAVAADLTTPAGVTAYLASTDFIAANVEKITGGMLGFTYRVTLKTPGPHKTVIVKHGLDYASSDKSLMTSAERTTFEYEALTAIASSGLVTPESIVRVPRALFHDPTAHVLVMEDIAPVRSLSSVLLEAFENGTIESVSDEIGTPLGDFMGKFYEWSARPSQATLRKRFSENIASTETSSRMKFDFALKTAERYGMKKEWMDGFVEQGMKDSRQGGDAIIMGDFWVGNILISSSPRLQIYIIDWEMARCGRVEVDVGSLASDAHSISYARRSTSPKFRLMQGFMRGFTKHFTTINDVQIAFAAGRDVMGFGADEPWSKSEDENTRREIVRCGLDLLEAGIEGNVETIRRNVIVRDMYSYN